MLYLQNRMCRYFFYQPLKLALAYMLYKKLYLVFTGTGICAPRDPIIKLPSLHILKIIYYYYFTHPFYVVSTNVSIQVLKEALIKIYSRLM